MGPDSGNLRDAYHRLFFTETAVMARDWDQNDIARLDTGLQPMIERYLTLPARDYLAADSARVALMQRMSDFHRDYDLLLCPTTPIPAFAAGHEVPEEWSGGCWTEWALFTWPWNMTGQPAITVPCGVTDAGLPIGAQLIGPRHRDDLVLRAARVYQQARPLTRNLPAQSAFA